MGEIDPVLRLIPVEIYDLIDAHKMLGLVFLSYYVTNHRYPSNEEFEHSMQEIYAKEVNLWSRQLEAA